MAKARATFAKRERDRAKRERADMKRERRAERAAESEETPDEPVDTSGNDRILEAVAALHERFEAGELTMDDFEEQRAELMSRLAIE
jgi:hypothetical protein